MKRTSKLIILNILIIIVCNVHSICAQSDNGCDIAMTNCSVKSSESGNESGCEKIYFSVENRAKKSSLRKVCYDGKEVNFNEIQLEGSLNEWKEGGWCFAFGQRIIVYKEKFGADELIMTIVLSKKMKPNFKNEENGYIVKFESLGMY